MKAGTYILEAESAFYTFEPVTAVIDSSAEALPDVAADRVQVCGKIDVEKSELAKYAGEKRNVMIKAKGGYVEQKMQANENGDFCTEVKMGEYVVTPIVNLDESSFGLYLTPEHYEIKVEGDPIKNLKFSQIKVDVSGRVKCFAQDECKDVTIQLAVAHGEPKTVKVSHNTFSFASVLPGKYKLSIAKPDFCWQETEMSLEIRSQSLKDIEFVQTGYALQYDAEKEVEVRINGKAESVLFKEGRNAHCLAAKGKYQITPMGCYKFAEATLTYDTTSPKVVRLVPEKYLIKGILNVNDASLADISKYVAISVKTTDSTGAVTEDKIAVEPEGQKYIFQFFSKGQVGVQITPYVRVQGESAEANILFYPKSHSVTVKDQCIMGKDAVAFGVNKGLIIRGKVTPAVSNIMVTARDTQDDSVVATATTNEAGEYKLGPLYDDKKYSVTAQKEGYRMTQETENQYNFLAEQLSYLSIKVSENDGTPLAGVIFDLSHSARTYRNNTRTTEEGKAIFEQLISGDYYLKPLLKEYKFNPEQMALKIVQGKHMTVEFKARRVAFSAYGKVQLLNQRPVHNIAVEALCVSCSTPSMETSTTDQEGRFRIRGLQPKQKYALSVRQDSDRNNFLAYPIATIFRSTPQRIELTVNEADIKDVNFVTLKLVGDVAVSGIVNFEGEKTEYPRRLTTE